MEFSPPNLLLHFYMLLEGLSCGRCKHLKLNQKQKKNACLHRLNTSLLLCKTSQNQDQSTFLWKVWVGCGRKTRQILDHTPQNVGSMATHFGAKSNNTRIALKGFSQLYSIRRQKWLVTMCDLKYVHVKSQLPHNHSQYELC